MSFPADIAALLGDIASDDVIPVGAPLPGLVPLGRGERSIVGGAYEGASRFDADMATWSPQMNSADMDILPEKAILDARVRDAIRNDGYVAGGANIHKDSIVGSMFLLNAKPQTRALGKGFDDKWEEDYQEEVESKFTLAAESLDNWFDVTRKNTLTDMVRLAVGVYVSVGEVLASAEWLKDSGRPFKTAINMIDVDRLSDPMVTSNFNVSTLLMQGRLRRGVELDERGAAVAYHIQTNHPSESWARQQQTWKRVPARLSWGRPQMIHIHEQKRVDETRGIAEIVAGLKELRITKKFRDVVLQNAVLNATYAATIESELDSNAIFQRLGAQGSDDYDSAINGYIGGWMSQIGEYAKGAKGLQMDGVRVPHLPPGTKLQLRPAGQGGPLGSEFESSLLRYIAAGLGVSYEQLSRDYTQTNYSSARAAMTETWKFMQARKRVVADRFASYVYRLWLEEMVNAGQIESLPASARQSGWLYQDPMRIAALSQADWIGASRGQIDELKETQAAVLRLKFGLSTREMEIARFGRDWRKDFRQLSRENKLAESLGIELTDQPSNTMNAASGSPRQKAATSGNGNATGGTAANMFMDGAKDIGSDDDD